VVVYGPVGDKHTISFVMMKMLERNVEVGEDAALEQNNE
jgi:hypothetical protein